ncbi:muscle M-line assembly protein unc-89-like [Bombus pyrosoma]|uniref:muscle M-line assembly protein unc-89-like n=1 Tax=Bombus pyrosoma TaxID=396416 RepID=UPI001CB8EBE7|nr:muscle M-line assembly protein unc-89-like [Bombus pyrosoma]
MRKYQNTRESSYDSSPYRDSSPSIQDTEYTKSVATSVENLSRVMEATDSSGASSSGNSSVSNASAEPIALAKTIDNTRALLKKKSFVQVINNYIKAGIEEGKRQAKKYIRKALSFGVKSGYLIPAGPQGQVIRVSPTLIESKKSDIESRKRRRRARRGEEDPIADAQKRRRLTPPWDTKNITRRENTPKPETPPRKRRKTSKNSIQAKKSPRKKTKERITRQSGKRRTRKEKKDTLIISRLCKNPSNKIDETQKKIKSTRNSYKYDVDMGKEDHRNRRAKSSRSKKGDNENSKENKPDSSNEDAYNAELSGNEEINERMAIVRQKSTTSREDALRNGSGSFGNPGKIVEEKLDASYEENNENDTIENLN